MSFFIHIFPENTQIQVLPTDMDYWRQRATWSVTAEAITRPTHNAVEIYGPHPARYSKTDLYKECKTTLCVFFFFFFWRRYLSLFSAKCFSVTVVDRCRTEHFLTENAVILN